MTFKICIIDMIGLAYDGSTLSKQGLGGSESAVILAAKELVKLGNEVTVFNHCEDSMAQPGVYDGVTYLPHKALKEDKFVFDIVISSRTIIPFVPAELYHRFSPDQYGRFHDCSLFENIKKTAKRKILWKHDTFCMGDDILEDLLLQGYIDEMFTLSDFHSTYVTNSDHGKKRNYEVLKNKFFQTRNGIVNYIDEVDISAKDPNLCVFNASVSKGMIPLVTKIWPKIQQEKPNAKLVIIGGYYRFSEKSAPDAQELEFRRLSKIIKDTDLNITFTGIIPQYEIANILAEASFFLFPGAFPETFGISTLESLAYNTPLVATRFGALEETAVEGTSYFIDYAIQPTPLSTFINEDNQVEKFVKVTLDAMNNTYLHQQKMYSCNAIKDVITWDTVILQWQQHFCQKLYKYFPIDLYKKVTYINNKLHRVFNRRITNDVEWGTVKLKSQEQPIAIITPFYNAEKYISDCILSVASQNYANYLHILINDKSTDNSFDVALSTINSLHESIRGNFHLIDNASNVGAVKNQIETIRQISNDNTIIMLLDGDDSFVNNNTVLDFYNELYDNDTEFTYGSCWSMADNIPLIAQPYPKEIRENRDYRNYRFNWGMPYPHLRTFRKKLINRLTDADFQNDNGEWYRAGGDNAIFYNIIEQANPNGVKVVSEIMYNYNDLNPLNDYKVNATEQNSVALEITKKKDSSKEYSEKRSSQRKNSEGANLKKILIAIPTAKNIEVETFKSIYDLKVPEGYETDFQFFYGYRIDQIRNLIANWVINKYDYLFSVDSDITFASDTLEKMLSHDVDVVSGIYRQRIEERQTIEIYEKTANGGVTHMNYNKLKNRGLVEVDACGFGCVLVKKNVIQTIPYPQFEYHVALNHHNTVSEDVDFCTKATNNGFQIFCDTSIICDHIGSTKFKVK